MAASLENLAVFAYTAGLAAATAGKLGTVPPAVATFATTVKGQHQQHAAAWNAVLKSHGKAPVTVTNPTLTPTVQSDFAKVTDVTGLAQLALTLETIAAQTYQAETAKLKSTAAIALSSSIQPVEMQHIAILYYVLGMYPGAQTASGTPLAFNPTIHGGLNRAGTRSGGSGGGAVVTGRCGRPAPRAPAAAAGGPGSSSPTTSSRSSGSAAATPATSSRSRTSCSTRWSPSCRTRVPPSASPTRTR